ncbi:ycf20-like protein [Cucumis melo var. makuwa]|uniref:Ycf20-like protein n=1 Tax=Cucumis melo var. makuwa TaxID=1194695 RepID=A0A5A7T286_CUCMM|nr:ycf20-like protein [Cucumis melo var. makuwa]
MNPSYWRYDMVKSRPSSLRSFRVKAVQDTGGPRSPSRRTLFGGISLLGCYYVAQTISLSFVALGVNDVFAAVVCVLLIEPPILFMYNRRNKKIHEANEGGTRGSKENSHEANEERARVAIEESKEIGDQQVGSTVS